MNLLEFNLFLECIDGIDSYLAPNKLARVRNINEISEDEQEYEADYEL